MEVHHSGSIQASIRTRPQLVPSFANAKGGDNATLSGHIEPSSNHTPLTQQSLTSIFDNFAQKLTAIEKERSQNIQIAKNKANTAQAHGMRRGMGIAVSHGVEEDKKRTINDIEKAAVHQKNILFLQAKQTLLQHQQTYFSSLLEMYKTLPPSSRGTASTNDRLNQCQQIINQAFEEEKKIFTALGKLEQANEPTITAAIKTIALADAVRMRALHPFVEHSINTALDQIEETSELLRTLSQSKNQFLNIQDLAAFHEELDQRRANYLLAEALFNETARDIALNNASYLQTKIEEIKLELARTFSEKIKAAESDAPLFDQKISLLTTLSTALEAAQQAYERIADDSSLKIKISTASLNNSIELPTTTTLVSSNSPALNQTCQSLSALASQTTITSKTAGLNILSKLSDFPQTENDHAIFGRRGEMELVEATFLSLAPNAKLAQEGINLVRLAVFRDFGAQGLQRFDAYFHDKIAALKSPGAQNVLTIGELKEFIKAENQINSSAFYLSSAHPIAELIFAESDPVEDKKFLKADGTSFNPFSKMTPNQAALSADQEKAEGLTSTRAALKEFLKNLPPELRQLILNRFDDKFKTAKTPLTIGELRSFIKEEIKNLSASNLNVTGPFLYSLARLGGFEWFERLGGAILRHRG